MEPGQGGTLAGPAGPWPDRCRVWSLGCQLVRTSGSGRRGLGGTLQRPGSGGRMITETLLP